MIVESKDIVAYPKVSVVILTYNQENYISQCVESVLSQITDFSFELIISDDCSVDRTKDICLEYQNRFPRVVRLLLQDVNKGVASNYRDAINLARGNYIASMGGDDYWIIDSKLQIQKEYLDNHPNCGLCYTDINSCDERGIVLQERLMSNMHRSQSFEDHLINRGYIAPLTWLFRKELVQLYDDKGAFTDESFAFALDAFMCSRVDYIDIVSANYRLTPNSLSRQSETKKYFQQWLGVFRTQCFYLDKYKNSINEFIDFKVRINGYLELIPIAYDLGKQSFIEEAMSFFNSHGIDISPFLNTCDARKRAEAVRNSMSYRLGRVLLKPFRWIRFFSHF